MPTFAFLTVLLLATLGAAEPPAGQEVSHCDLNDAVQCQTPLLIEQTPLKLADLPQQSESLNGFRLLDTVLVISVDGHFHALDRTTGHKLWSRSMDDVPAASWTNETFQLGNLVNVQPASPTNTSAQELFIVEPQSGALFVLPSDASPSESLQRLPFTIPYLHGLSPYRSGGRSFSSKKEVSVFALELDSGRVLHGENTTSFLVDLEVDDKRQVFIERIDYNVTVKRPGFTTQKLGFSAYRPMDQHTQQIWHRTRGDLFIQPNYDGQVFSFSTAAEGFNWQTVFSQPIVAVFDVVESPERREATALLQPLPNLANDFPGQAVPEAPAKDYVGIVNGSLFAMSSDNFPFVRFAKVSHDLAQQECQGLECFTGVRLSQR